MVATVLTVYGIETGNFKEKEDACNVATVLTVYGIETYKCTAKDFNIPAVVATVLTVYGIETIKIS